ncbi:hypothetical protein AB0C12_38715 [Actinoplanes sp. NPDC048967]|uniref:hypothetical protein n=1 Tax=Actinoplanes sp. NPDC048967 TaxID=3155269 RepID=UPI0033DDC4D7
MLTVRLSSTQPLPGGGTPGSSAVQRGFRVGVEIRPHLEAYRVAVVWTPDGWQSTRYVPGQLTQIADGSEIWSAEVSWVVTPPTTFFYAVVGVGFDGPVWDNNGGWNYRWVS